jgi:hypothetical protein
MTAGELIARVDELRPNAYSAEQKLRWLRRLDGQILAEIWETHGAESQPRRDEHRSSADTADVGQTDDQWSSLRPAALPPVYAADTQLLAPFPWDEGVYTAWLFCQIDLHNGEIGKYTQSLQLLAAAWRSLADWVNRSRRPLGAPAWRM